MQLVQDFDLSSRNTLGLSATARFGTSIQTTADVESLATEARERSLPLRILGSGSNVVLRPNFDGILALMRITGCEVGGKREKFSLVSAGAGVDWHEFVCWTLAHDLPGLENLAGIPGTVGAAPVQNIGAYGVELASRFHSLRAYDTRLMRSRVFRLEECGFDYRTSQFKRNPTRYIITDVTFALPNNWRPVTDYRGLEDCDGVSPCQIMNKVLRIRREKLPDWRRIGNVGSFFQNPVVPNRVASKFRLRHNEMPIYPMNDTCSKLSAAWMIDRCELRNYRVGAAGISANHALIIVNHGGADQTDIAAIAKHVQTKVFERFGIMLIQEPEWV